MIGARLSPARWASTQSPVALFVVRLLLVANSVVLAVVGGLCVVAVSWPAGIAGAAATWGLAALLIFLVPYTNPRRGDRARW